MMRRSPPGPVFGEPRLARDGVNDADTIPVRHVSGGRHHDLSRQGAPGGGDFCIGCDVRPGAGRACALARFNL